MKSVLLIAQGRRRPFARARRKVKKLLKRQPNVTLKTIRKFSYVRDLNMDDYDCIVLLFRQKDRKEHKDLVDRMIGYVHNGGTVLALCGATASFGGHGEYVRMIGALYQKCRRMSLLKIVGFLVFQTRDRLSIHHLSDDCHVRLYAQNEPVYWNRKVGKGMVSCFPLGYGRKTFDYPETGAVIYDAIHRK